MANHQQIIFVAPQTAWLAGGPKLHNPVSGQGERGAPLLVKAALDFLVMSAPVPHILMPEADGMRANGAAQGMAVQAHLSYLFRVFGWYPGTRWLYSIDWGPSGGGMGRGG